MCVLVLQPCLRAPAGLRRSKGVGRCRRCSRCCSQHRRPVTLNAVPACRVQREHDLWRPWSCKGEDGWTCLGTDSVNLTRSSSMGTGDSWHLLPSPLRSHVLHKPPGYAENTAWLSAQLSLQWSCKSSCKKRASPVVHHYTRDCSADTSCPHRREGEAMVAPAR